MWHNTFGKEYQHLLKNNSSYSKSTDHSLEFTYSTRKEQALEDLRLKYQLDSVAGNGTDLEQILNLFKWVKTTVIHDGADIYSGNRNASEILSHSEKGKGVNCRMVATAMCEVFLAMGFKARFITGTPIGFDFKDCHVVNVVYSEELNKWLYLDPSTGFYVKNSQDEILSYQEFREHLSQSKEIKICRIVELDELSDDEYIRYMTKNSFILMSNNRFGSNTESDGQDISWYYLIPNNFLPEMTRVTKKENYNVKEVYTTSDKDFWEL